VFYYSDQRRVEKVLKIWKNVLAKVITKNFLPGSQANDQFIYVKLSFVKLLI